MAQLLVFNADDYGLSPGVCRGILQAAGGVVRSTTVIANYVRPDDALGLAALGMSVGAHLNASAGPPLTRYYPSGMLTDDGRFNKTLALAEYFWEDKRHRNAVLTEWSAQLEKLRQLGLELTHIDSHHHVHLLPPLFPLALQLARRHSLALRTRTAEQRQLARQHSVRTPGELVEGYFGAGNLGPQQLIALLEDTSADVVEVMCHPGKADALLKERSGYRSEREEELKVLGSPALAEILTQRGWRVCGYDF